MKSAREWMEEWSGSGPFDRVTDCDEAVRIVEAIQQDAMQAHGRCRDCRWGKEGVDDDDTANAEGQPRRVAT
jgi:hypothetical protein